ncbi:radical SAM domain protein [Desulfovibrio ferrophilus]|uniref:Radical SAM domain protein n=1 Tax=Desulfovibrio ferrophilus TaxID=241368 RepID=A0A2Z6B217_9BACT|nr:radical SAM domain protein [Desulfovibrio ferrophilus]
MRFLTPHIKALGAAPERLLAPSRYRSDLLGHKRSMLPRWEELGLREKMIDFWEEDWFEVG